jgi:hypothetical protein
LGELAGEWPDPPGRMTPHPPLLTRARDRGRLEPLRQRTRLSPTSIGRESSLGSSLPSGIPPSVAIDRDGAYSGAVGHLVHPTGLWLCAQRCQACATEQPPLYYTIETTVCLRQKSVSRRFDVAATQTSERRGTRAQGQHSGPADPVQKSSRSGQR